MTAESHSQESTTPTAHPMRKSGNQLPLPKARIALLIFAAFAMLISLLGAIVRSHLQGSWLPLPAPVPDLHGALMVYGFLGTAISLERAVAWRAGSAKHPRWGFAAPACAVLGTLTVVATTLLLRLVGTQSAPVAWLSTHVSAIPGSLWSLAMAILCAMYVGVWGRQHSHAVVIQFAGAAVGCAGVALWACGLDADILSPLWMIFLIFTIIGERLELGGATSVSAITRTALIVATALSVIVLPVLLAMPLVGYPLLALPLGTLLILMMIHDTARKTFKAGKVTGFMGICMLTGYAWGILACAIWLIVPYGGLGTYSLWWDLALHAFALGFVMAMVVAHVVVIVPSIIRRAMPFHPILWMPLIVFQLGLLMRALGTVRNAELIWRAGDAITIVGMITMMIAVITLLSVAAQRRKKRALAMAQREAGSRQASKPQTSTPHSRNMDPFVPEHHGHIRRPLSAAEQANAARMERELKPMPYLAAALTVVLVLTVLSFGTHPSWALSSDRISAQQAAQSANQAQSGNGSALQGSNNATQFTPTGHTTEADVRIVGMSFEPNTITVPQGDALTIHLTNTGDQIHDLVIGNISSGRLSPTQSADVHLPALGQSIDGWCSIAGHKQMGMILHIVVNGASANSTTGNESSGSADDSTMNGMDHTMHSTSGSSSSDSANSASVAMSDLTAQAKREAAYSAAMPAYTGGDRNTHLRKFHIDITTGKQQVTDTLTRETWTFNGTQPAPILHGKVGDEFEITLTNHTDMDHSIDFHAGDDAVPDTAMSSIAPGKSKVYRFTAARAGIWMYHCSSMPMSLHIANGMYGAVLIEPQQPLPAVDAEYVLVQSEQYLGANGQGANTAAIAAVQPSIVAFNGRAFQYDAHPLTMPAGGRARIWVLNAGPNVPLSFHIVGAQFDTVWTEGQYTIYRNHATNQPDGNAITTGSQAVSFLPAQGGFVEMTIPKAGHYPIVNHIMSYAEKGAHGIMEVK